MVANFVDACMHTTNACAGIIVYFQLSSYLFIWKEVAGQLHGVSPQLHMRYAHGDCSPRDVKKCQKCKLKVLLFYFHHGDNTCLYSHGLIKNNLHWEQIS